jgi:pimeloyl-ACP methyl ester carboxylesterase
LIINLFGNYFLLPGMGQDLFRPEKFPEYLDLYQPQMEITGFKQAVLSTIRSGILYNRRETFQKFGTLNLPVLLVWGKEDRVIPFRISEMLKELIPNAGFKAIDQAGHVPHYELPDTVNPIIIDFLKSV